MNIRSWAGVGALALASAAVFGWGISPALAQSTLKSTPTPSTADPSYALTLRGNVGDSYYEAGGDCNYCDVDGCVCLYADSGTSTTWKWNNHNYLSATYEVELDYLNVALDSGAESYCDPAIGEIFVTGTFGNELYAETTGMLCGNAGLSEASTYTGSYVIVGGTGVYGDASGSGGVSLGVDSDATDLAVTSTSQPAINGQFQMTGNISLSTLVPACTAVGKANC